jgi:AcrR family transcriptional regulator
MFENAEEKVDRRVVRTRDRLGDALVELLLEKPFDDVTVQEVLTRAKVSRSTFYAHYRDKNDLFLSDVDDFFASMSTLLTRHGDHSDRVAPVAEFFTHIAESRDFYNALVESGRIQDVKELGEGHFARNIEARLARRASFSALDATRRTAFSSALAGSLFALLSWWINHSMALTPRQMDDLFHELVASGVASPSLR